MKYLLLITVLFVSASVQAGDPVSNMDKDCMDMSTIKTESAYFDSITTKHSVLESFKNLRNHTNEEDDSVKPKENNAIHQFVGFVFHNKPFVFTSYKF